AAIVSGLAPGSDALTTMVGKSTSGSGATGSSRYAISPNNTTPTASNALATGLRINGRERFIRGRRFFGSRALGDGRQGRLPLHGEIRPLDSSCHEFDGLLLGDHGFIARWLCATGLLRE